MKRVEFKLKQNDDKYLKSWLVTDFANKISELHYKQELLNEINKRILEGVKPQNLLIFDKSFSIHKTYRFLGTHNLNTENGIKNIYHLGVPFPLYVNSKIDAIAHTFKSFSEMFTNFNKDEVKDASKLDKNLLHTFIKEAMESTHEELKISTYKSYLINRIENIPDKELKQNYNEIVEGELKSLLKGYKETFGNNQRLLEFDKDEVGFKLTKEEEVKRNDLVKKVSGKFEYHFNTNKKPVVGYFDENKNTIEILCVSFIKQNGKDEKQFDLKEISHNSPFFIGFAATYVLVQLFHQMYANKIDRKYNFNELDDTDIESEDNSGIDQSEINETEDELELFRIIKNRLGKLLEEEDTTDLYDNEIVGDQSESDRTEEDDKIPTGVVAILQNLNNFNVEKMAKNFAVNGFGNADLDLNFEGEDMQE